MPWAAESTRTTWRRVVDRFGKRFARLTALLDAPEADVLAYLAFPPAHWRLLCSNALLAEQHDEWQGSRGLSAESLAQLTRRASLSQSYPLQAEWRRRGPHQLFIDL